MRCTLALLAIVLLIPATLAADPMPLGLRVPDGFEVTEYAGSDLANDIYCMTIDPKGRVIVSGRGYIRILVEGKNGKAERALPFADGPKDGAMGPALPGRATRSWSSATAVCGVIAMPMATARPMGRPKFCAP